MHKASSSIEEVPCCFSRWSVKYQSHTGQKIAHFDTNWAFPDCNSSLNWHMMMKWYTKLDVTQERCPIVCQGHPSNFMVTQLKKNSIFTQIGRFWTVTPVWIHQWLWNDAQSLNPHRIGALLFFKVVCQTSISHRTKIAVFDPNWAFLDCNSSLNSPMDLKWCTKLDII